ncbi:MAG: ATP-binding protein [Gemmatimonadota bacterium]
MSCGYKSTTSYDEVSPRPRHRVRREYGPDGGRITLTARPTEAGDVTLTVTDTGPGILGSERATLLDRFARGESGRRRAHGSGPGLSIVKAMAETHGASVAGRDTEGGGATFELRLQGRT